MQADDAVLQGMAEAERGKAERAQEHGTAEKATYEGVSAAHLPDNEKQTGRVTFGALPTAEEAGAPEGATIVDGERGQHLTGDKLTSHFTLKDFVFGNVNELRYIELPSEEEKRTLRRVPDHVRLALPATLDADTLTDCTCDVPHWLARAHRALLVCFIINADALF